MALTILNVAFPLAAVGPDAVGGAEQVLSLLDGRACRLAAEERFSAAATASQYLALHQGLTATQGPPARHPAARRSPAPASGGP